MSQKLRALAPAFLLTAALTGCADGPDDNDYNRICVAVSTQDRVPEQLCPQNPDRYIWWYIPVVYGIPAMYMHTDYGGHTKPAHYGTRPVPLAPQQGTPPRPHPAPAKPPPQIKPVAPPPKAPAPPPAKPK